MTMTMTMTLKLDGGRLVLDNDCPQRGGPWFSDYVGVGMANLQLGIPNQFTSRKWFNNIILY